VFCEGLLTPPNYLRRDPSNVTDDTEAHHTAHTTAGLRHEGAVLPTRILVGKVAVTTFVTHKHPFRRISRIPEEGGSGGGVVEAMVVIIVVVYSLLGDGVLAIAGPRGV